jgi:nitrite reductase/ring-hydroxylating ferredoxin subunit
MAGDLIRLCSTNDVEDGAGFRVAIHGREDLAVFRVGDQYFVTDDLCTHNTASLSEDGFIEGFVLECTWHQGKFDLRTGEVLAAPCTRALRTYEPIIRDGAIYVCADSLHQ